jgi:hypothetical protein
MMAWIYISPAMLLTLFYIVLGFWRERIRSRKCYRIGVGFLLVHFTSLWVLELSGTSWGAQKIIFALLTWPALPISLGYGLHSLIAAKVDVPWSAPVRDHETKPSLEREV